MKRVAAVIALVAVVLLAWWLASRDDGAEAPARAAAPAARARPNPALERFPRLAALVDGAERSDRAGLHLLADPDLPIVIADFVIASRFPPHSRPLEPGMGDLIEPNRRHETLGPVKHADRTTGPPELQVMLTGDKFRLLGDEPIQVWFELLRKGERTPVRIVEARVFPVEILSRAATGEGVPIAFAADPSHVHTASWSIAGTPFADHTGYVNLEVTYDYGGVEPGVETIEIYVQPTSDPPATFTGKVREELVDGSLMLHVGVVVHEAGDYVIDANVYDADGKPTAFLRAKLALAEGPAEVPMQVFGRVVHEREARAPFTLTDLRGFRFMLGEDPDRRYLPDASFEHRTQAYPPDAFSRAEFWDAAKEEQVQRLRDEAARGTHELLKQRLGDAPDRGWTPAI